MELSKSSWSRSHISLVHGGPSTAFIPSQRKPFFGVAVFSNASNRGKQVVWTLAIPQKKMQLVRVELPVEGKLIRKDGKDKRVVLGKFH